MTKVERYVQFMETVAADQSHGYSQQSRWGTPDYDCSSLVIEALEQAGIPARTKGATYTGNMYPVLRSLGFSDVKYKVNLATGDGLQRGDILLNERYHTAVYAGNGKIVHARGQSYGSSKAGDQGTEIAITNYYNYSRGWDHVLRYNDMSGAANTQQAATSSTIVPINLSGDLCRRPKAQGRVTASALNVRTWAGVEWPRIKAMPELARGSMIEVCDCITDMNADPWYYIRIAGQWYGFVSAKYIEKI